MKTDLKESEHDRIFEINNSEQFLHIIHMFFDKDPLNWDLMGTVLRPVSADGQPMLL